MTLCAWRIATDAPAYEADDMTGAGARLTGGRWNEAGVPIVYAAENRALACLETIVHLNAGALPLNRTLVEIAIPDDLWAARERSTRPRWSAGTPARQAGPASASEPNGRAAGDRRSSSSPPSWCPRKPTSSSTRCTRRARPLSRKLRLWTYDPRMVKAT